MTFQVNEGQIFIHTNVGAEGNKPVIKGSCKIGGVEYDIALWGSKSGRDGSYSGKISLPRNKPAQQQETHKGFDKQGDVAKPVDDMSDSIPF